MQGVVRYIRAQQRRYYHTRAAIIGAHAARRWVITPNLSLFSPLYTIIKSEQHFNRTQGKLGWACIRPNKHIARAEKMYVLRMVLSVILLLYWCYNNRDNLHKSIPWFQGLSWGITIRSHASHIASYVAARQTLRIFRVSQSNSPSELYNKISALKRHAQWKQISHLTNYPIPLTRYTRDGRVDRMR